MINVKFKKIDSDATIPKYATDGSLGLDLIATSKNKVYNPKDGYLEYISYGTGIAVELPKGYAGLLLPRSSISNKNLDLANSCGLLDQDFIGEISFRFRKLSSDSNGEYNIGDKIGQLLVIPCVQVTLEQVEELTETERGEGGYGSTDRTYYSKSQAW